MYWASLKTECLCADSALIYSATKLRNTILFSPVVAVSGTPELILCPRLGLESKKLFFISHFSCFFIKLYGIVFVDCEASSSTEPGSLVGCRLFLLYYNSGSFLLSFFLRLF